MQYIQQHILKFTFFFGIMTLIIGAIMMFYFPQSADLPHGFTSPIIAFEFAKVPEDLLYLTGTGAIETINRAQMDAGHQWDMVFPFFYGGFIFLLLLQSYINGQRIAAFGMLFALLIIPFDIHENLTLLEITSVLEQGNSPTDSLQHLPLATWLKWGAIGISIGVLSLVLYFQKKYLSAILADIVALLVLITWLSGDMAIIAESMTLSLTVLFIYFTVKIGLKIFRTPQTT